VLFRSLIRGKCEDIGPQLIPSGSSTKNVKFKPHNLCPGFPAGENRPDTRDVVTFSLSLAGSPVNFSVLSIEAPTIVEDDRVNIFIGDRAEYSRENLDALGGADAILCRWVGEIQASFNAVLVKDVTGIYEVAATLKEFDGSTTHNLTGEWRIVAAQQPQLPPGPVVSDLTVSSVAVAVAQASAVGVEGTSSAVLIRNDEVVPVTSRVSSGVGPRGGVVLEAEGLRATVASSSGARVATGVVVSPSGDLEVSVVGGLVPGAVVEVWVNSSPRLVAAARVPGDHAEGDALTLTVPLGAPLDGGEPIEAGAHTLQIRMFTDAGFEVLATGITVGGVVPAGVPAGEGPVRLDGVLFALLGAAGLVGLAVRRTVVSG
jgi:hypothetical protein